MEKKIRWHTRGSLFSKTLAMLSLLSLITVVAMFFFVQSIVTRSQKQRFRELHSDHLKQASVYIDGQFEGMERSNKQLLRSKDTISLMVNAALKNSDISYRVVATLRTCQEQNEMIKTAFLYLPTSQDVYSSLGNYLPLEDSSRRDIVEAYLKKRETSRIPGEESVTTILHHEDALYVVTDFCVPNFIGALFMQVDLEQLNQHLLADHSEPAVGYLLLDENQEMVMAEGDWREEAASVIASGDYLNLDTGTSGSREDYIFQNSPRYDLTYGIRIVPGADRVRPLVVIWTLLPFLLIYAVFSEFYSLYISRTIYKPINRLMQITAGQREGLSAAVNRRGKDELEFLEEEYQNTLGENLQHRELLATISQDLLSQLFRSILMGTAVSKDHIRTTMEGIGLADYMNGRYMALAGKIRGDQDRKRSSVEEGMYQRSLLAMLDEQDVSGFLQVHFFVDSEHLAVLLCFPEESSVIQMKTQVGQMIETITENATRLPYGVQFGKGKVYNDISSLRFSYQEAVEEVEYLCYLEDAPDAVPAEAPVRSDDYDRKYFSERGQYLAECAEKDRLEDALRASDSLVNELCECTEENRNAYLELISDILVEKMISTHITPEEIQEMNLGKTMNNVTGSSDTERIHGVIREMFTVMIKAIHSNSRKNRYKYVETAKEYIGVHYSDGNLSLNEVSEAVGISAPYLSGIFAEVNKGGFSSYLSSYRVAQARQFLEQTTQSVSEIGYKCGFNSAQSFSRVFKKHTGMAPGQYRDQFMHSLKSLDQEE